VSNADVCWKHADISCTFTPLWRDSLLTALYRPISIRAVRRRTGGRRRCWVVLWPAAAARRAFFIDGGGVALWSAAAASAASDRMRKHWNSALAKQAFFFWFYRGQQLHLWSPLGGWRRRVNCEYAWCARFHSRNEWIVHCLISGGSYECSVQCWDDAESAGVENAALENAGLENVGIINMASVEWLK